MPYDVSNTDYFRDLRKLVLDPIVEVGEQDLGSRLRSLDSFVVSDATIDHTTQLRSFVRRGGNLVLTDRALQLLPDLLGVTRKQLGVKLRYAYVGYSDLNRRHWLTRHLSQYTKQTYDPIGIGYRR